jgi:tyrosyl-tRNA synthetase
MDAQERLSLIERNTEEVVKEEELKDLLEEDNPKGYIGFAPTSSPHIGHATTLRKVADFLEAGIEFDILVADEHARLDTEKTDEELVDARSEFYEKAMRGMISASGADPDDINVVRGSDFQNSGSSSILV